MARCPGCDNLHLIADRLGWFEEGSVDVRDLLARRGEEVRYVTTEDGVLELTAEDVIGRSRVDALHTGKAVQGGADGNGNGNGGEAPQ